MSDKNAQLKKLLEVMVQREVKRVLPGMLREEVGKLLTEMKAAPVQGNGHKRVALMETSGNPEDFSEYPTMNAAPGQTFDRAAFMSKMGMEGFNTIGGSGPSVPVHQGLITAPAVTEHGTAVEVPADKVPEHVINAFNKNYSGFLKAMDSKKPK
jgi:hypothetical protein